ncbi:putative transporter [Lunatimonas lonarensis]|uniref:Putative transporter n=1 Tax=Lunatimonas lonarensis TaxID=1232681 RepID=R7ZY32_9BACT|nr:bile acid:sodium symporter family protein [Lunatimonas lonarensis]EON79055.1 putative transporter [Lunatimonas lonarensis]
MVIFLFHLIKGNIENGDPFLIFSLLALSFGVKGHKVLRGLSFTLLILAVASAALFYPDVFLQLGSFETAELITPLIQLIMFGMGTSMGVKDFIALARSPKAVIIGVGCQFTLMPGLAFLIVSLAGFPEEIAAGIILLGCAPTSVASPVMCYLAKANVALTITIVSITTLIAPFIIPFLMKFLAAGFIEIDTMAMMWNIIQIVLIPIGAGLLFNKFLAGKSDWLDKAMPYVSMAGIVVIVAIIIAAGQKSLINMGLMLLAAVLVHNVLGYFTGYWTAKFFKLEKQDCRTIAITTGMQNAGLVSGIAKTMGKIATVGLASAVCGPLMGFTSSLLASYWNAAKQNDRLP